MRLLKLYVRALASLQADRRTLSLLVLVNVVAAGLQFADPLLFGRVIGSLSEPAAPLAQSVGGGSVAVALSGIAGLLLAWGVVGMGGVITSIFAALHSERLAHRNRLEVMSRFLAHGLALPPSFHGEASSGRLIKTMLTGADVMFGLWLTFFREQLATVTATLVLLPLTVLLNWRLAMALVVLVVLFCVMTVIVVRHTEAGQRRAQSYQALLAQTAQDSLANVLVVQSFTRIAAEMELFGGIVRQVIEHQFPVLTWWAVINVLTRAASTVTVVAIVVLGAVLHAQGQASVGEIVGFMGLAAMLIARLDGALSFVARVAMEIPNVDDFFAVLDARSTLPERVDAEPMLPVGGEVVFEGVGFAYPGSDKVLRDVSFTARPGTCVALVGPTGAGKSTVAALLQRMWDPQAGRITIDGQDLRYVTLDSLRKSVGVVFQDAMLLNRSIRDNVLVGRPEATPEQVEHACRMADAHEFIMRQPHGYDTVVGERGASLSGGQRQRLAIARALLKDPPILILDEATSALDTATEARVGHALKLLMAGRTTFVIAHRLSTIREADDILVFRDGSIVERGRFADLLARDGIFADLVATQLAASPTPTAAETSLVAAE